MATRTATLFNSFNVTRLTHEFLDSCIPDPSKEMQSAFSEAKEILKQRPVFLGIFGHNTGAGPVLCLELFYIAPDQVRRSTNRYLAYIVRNNMIFPVSIEKMSTVSKDVARQ